MKNLIDYLKDKIYYIMGATVLIIIILIIINSCSGGNGNSYEEIEQNMVNAAKEYYANHKKNLPKEEGNTIKITIGSLVDSELMESVVDPKNSNQTCEGYVEVTKVGNDYSYIPFLTCKGNYEPKYLTDIVKNSKLDEYGNGVYNIDGEYIYRGDDVKNYVQFNNQLWRIVKVDEEGDIKLVLANCTEDTYSFDESYNSESEYESGITTNYLNTNVRKVLSNYYKNTFDKDAKAKIVSKDLCIGKYTENDSFSKEKECSIIKENEKIGLLNAMDYKNASLSNGCTNLDKQECTNQNYLSSKDITTWLLNTSSENTYEAFYLHQTITATEASNYVSLNPVIYITSKSIIVEGKGTLEKPYIVK